MRQRVMIAMALSLDPELLIADEPTTALDVTIQAQILGCIAMLNARAATAVVLVTHDLGVVAEIADRVAGDVRRAVVEDGTLDQIFYDPQHPYTWGLLGSMHACRPSRSRTRLPQIAGSAPVAAATRPTGLPLPPALPARVRTEVPREPPPPRARGRAG